MRRGLVCVKKPCRPKVNRRLEAGGCSKKRSGGASGDWVERLRIKVSPGAQEGNSKRKRRGGRSNKTGAGKPRSFKGRKR